MAAPLPEPQPTPTPAPAPVKPGWQTTEFWLSTAAIVVGALMTAGVFVPNSTPAKIVAVAGIVLTAMGYSTSRATVKAAAEYRLRKN